MHAAAWYEAITTGDLDGMQIADAMVTDNFKKGWEKAV